MTVEFVDFKAIKAVVPIMMILSRYEITVRAVNGTARRGMCPLPAHQGAGDKESFTVDIEKNVWACHASVCVKARKGRKGGDVIEFVSAMEQCTLREAGLKLAGWFPALLGSATQKETKPEEGRGVVQPVAVSPAVASEQTSDDRFTLFREWLGQHVLSVLADTSLSDEAREAKLDAFGEVTRKVNALLTA